MGSRTGASYTSLLGKNRKVHKDIAILASPLSSGSSQSGTFFSMQNIASSSASFEPHISPQISSASSIPSETFQSPPIDASQSSAPERPLTKEECEARAKIVMGLLIKSNPILSVIYYALTFTGKIIEWYPEIESAYQSGGDDAVIQLLVEKALRIGLNIGVNMIVSEIADQSWTILKTDIGLDTTPGLDQVGKLAINQAFKVAIEAAKTGKPIDREFIYKQVSSALFDYFANSLMESKSDGSDSNELRQPYHIISELDSEKQKLLRDIVKRITSEITDELFERTENGKVPNRALMRRTLTKIMKERYSFNITDDEPYNLSNQHISKNIIVTDESSIRNTKNSIIISTMPEVNHIAMGKENQMKLSFGSIQWKHTPEEKDLAHFAAFLFHMESLIRNKPEADSNNILSKKVTFVVHSKTDDETKILMEQMFAFLLGRHHQFQIIEKLESRIEEITDDVPSEQIDAICLYSGGLDSTVGYLAAKQKYEKIKLVFVDHEIHRIGGYVHEIVQSLNVEKDLLKATSYSGGSNFLQQTRGFLYLTAAAIYANHLGSERIIISECGVTKYQPAISIADEITKTTHPYMLKLATELFKKKGINVSIKMPFDDYTKAEMVSLYRNHADLLKNTYSCRGLRITSDNKRECGYCMGCLIKNIALTYVTGQKQNQFLLDPLTNKCSFFVESSGKHIGFNYSKMESVLRLIDFTSSILRPDGSIHQTTIDMIEDYNKGDLFRRYSEDIIYGLFYMKRNDMIQNEKVLEKLSSIEKESWFKSERIDDRRKELLQLDKLPIL